MGATVRRGCSSPRARSPDQAFIALVVKFWPNQRAIFILGQSAGILGPAFTGLALVGANFNHAVEHLQVCRAFQPQLREDGLGINTPCELPILRIATFMPYLP